MSETTVKITYNDFAASGANKGAYQNILATCAKIHAQAVSFCPVDEGQLKNSLMFKVEDKSEGFNSQGGETAPADQEISLKPKELEGYIGTNSDHWYPEFGTRYQVAQPFLRPAGEAVMKGSDLQNIVKKYGREAMEEEYKRRKVKTSES